METKIFIVLTIAIILIGIYFFLLPPRVISIDPPDQAREVALNFPLIKNHLFRKLVFIPAIDFEPNTKYQIKLENIISPLGIGLSRNFSFSFQTQEVEKFPNQKIETSPKEPKPNLLEIPLDWQDYPLSCEAASLKMALAYKGIKVSENEIMEKIGFDLTPRQGDIWGNPYGVYWQPLARAGNNWREAEAFSGWNLKDLIREIELGNPVVVWGVLPTETLHDCSWYTPEGKFIKAFKETHTRLVAGFVGEAENPSKIILNDHLVGRLYWSTSYFLEN